MVPQEMVNIKSSSNLDCSPCTIFWLWSYLEEILIIISLFQWQLIIYKSEEQNLKSYSIIDSNVQNQAISKYLNKGLNIITRRICKDLNKY